MKGVISNRYPYSIAIPVGWTEGETGDADAFQGRAGQQVDVRFYESISDDPEAWFTKARDVLEGFAPIADERTVSHPAGAGRLFELHPTNQGQTLTLYRLVLIVNGNGWDLTWVSPEGSEAIDRPQFEAIANSFWPSTGPLNVWSLGVGDCFTSLPITEPGRGGTDGAFLGPLDGYAQVECSESHTGEVIAALSDVEADCDPTFETYVGRARAGSEFALLEFVPLHSADLPGGAASLCVVADQAGSSAGTAKASGR